MAGERKNRPLRLDPALDAALEKAARMNLRRIDATHLGVVGGLDDHRVGVGHEGLWGSERRVFSHGASEVAEHLGGLGGIEHAHDGSPHGCGR